MTAVAIRWIVRKILLRVRTEKCEAVSDRVARQNKNLEPAFDSIKSGSILRIDLGSLKNFQK